MKEGKWAQAEAILSTASGQFVDDQELRVAWAESLLAQRRHDEAYRQYEAALAIGPRKPALEFAAGQTASVAGLLDRAIEHFSMAQTLDPKNPAAPLMLGMVQRRTGQLDAAKASLLRAANMDPTNAFAWGTLADIALGENNLGLALQHVQRARELQPDSREWRLVEARVRARQGDPEAALMLLLPLDPSQRRDAPVVRLMAQCLGMLNRHEDAAALWLDAARADPASAELAYEAAIALQRAGDTSSARDLARDAQRLGHPAAAALVERLR
ncbi:tetratricopeptide repeat protein [Leptolyngbya sp. 15MV]|nr:tetratricopeptide repeat protein [Leptolyngbya sp. 15MV]